MKSEAMENGAALAAKPGRPTQERAAQITDQILAAAGELFRSNGYDATAMSAIARAVGIPKTTLYKRYAVKADLLKAVIDHQIESWSRIAGRSDANLPAELLPLLQCHVATMLHWATLPEVRALSRLAANLPHGPFGGGRLSMPGEENMKDILVGAITERGPASGVDANQPEAIAELLMTVVAGTVARLEPGMEISRSDASERAKAIVAVIARGSAAW